MKINKNINEIELCQKYTDGTKLTDICQEYKIGKLKAKDILLKNNIKLRDKNSPRIKRNFVVDDFHIKKYENTKDYYYVAISKIDSTEFEDCENLGGHLTNHIREKLNIEIPTLYDRRIYYQTTGNYWWEQWFNVEKREKKQTKKCPYCDWETVDIENLSGAFEVHLNRKHNITKTDFLIEHPEDKQYFSVANKTLNLQIETNKDKFVICKICGKKLARIGKKHLSKHNITKTEYINKYDDNVLSKQYRHFLSNFVNIMNLSLDGRNDIFTSKPEMEIMEMINSYGFKCSKNRKILNGKEIDIYIPEKKLAIEYNGLLWHTEKKGKGKKYHLEKTIACNKKGITLIHIFEDEYYLKKEIIQDRIKELLGVSNSNKILLDYNYYEIKPIKKTIARKFLSSYSLYNYSVKSSVDIGCYYNNILIGVSTFYKHNCKEWKYIGFVSNYNYKSPLCEEKIFDFFVNEYKPNKVIYFSDRRWINSNFIDTYNRMGFNFVKYISPNYSYYNPKIDKNERINKNNFNKQKLHKKYGFPLTMTETEMAKELGYDRIWDCGLIKYVWESELPTN